MTRCKTPIDCMTVSGHHDREEADMVVENHVSILILKPQNATARE